MNIRFLYSSNFSSAPPLYILDGVKQVVPLCTITLGLYVPIWQTPPFSRGPQAHLPITIHSGAAKRKVLKTFKIGEMWQNSPSSHAFGRGTRYLLRERQFFEIYLYLGR